MPPRIGPAEYIRKVRNGWQARPYVRGTRVNLGVYRTPEAARQAVNRYLAGKRDATPLPKFVVPAKGKPGRYRWHVRQPSRDDGTPGLNVYCPKTYPTPEAAYQAACHFLHRLDGAFAAAVLADSK